MKKNIIPIIILIIAITTGAIVLVYLNTSTKLESSRAKINESAIINEEEAESLDIGVSIVENGNIVAYYKTNDQGEEEKVEGNLFTSLVDDFIMGQKYTESIKMKNTGMMNTYNRITIEKIWFDKNGNEIDPSVLSSDLIELEIPSEQSWISNPDYTGGGTQLYYKNSLSSNDEVELIASLKLKPEIEDEFDDYSFEIRIHVEAIQAEKAVNAMIAKWGVEPEIDNNGVITSIRNYQETSGDM